MFFDDIDPAPSVTPVPNMGGLMDIPNGSPEVGLKGETITNGGLQPMTAIVGEGNVGKTLLLCYFIVALLAHYDQAENLVFDTENNFKKVRQRINALALYPELLYTEEELANNPKKDPNDLKRSTFTTQVQYWGDEMYDLLKKKLNERFKSGKGKVETPFRGVDNQPISVFPFINWAIDSISMFKVSNQEEFQDIEVGGKKRNMEAMRDAHAKSQLMTELPVLTGKHNLSVMMTAHIGKEHQLDPMKPLNKILAHLSQGKKIKNVPEKFLFLPQNVILMAGSKPLIASSSDKTCMYPKHGSDDEMKAMNDLQITTVLSLRNKAGVSGAPYEIISSQTEGYLPTLSEFHYCKVNDRFGLGGNPTTSHMVFYPDVKFTRNTIRELIREDVKLRNAIRLTSELLQIRRYWPSVPVEMLLDPEEIYVTLTEKGYNWDDLLQTRGYWTYDQYTNPIPFLSGMDLLNMCAGLYKPYWMK